MDSSPRVKPPRTDARIKKARSKACPRILIEDVRPSLDDGRYPVKRVSGRACEVQAVVFRDGHAAIRAVVKWRRKTSAAWSEVPMRLVNPGLDLWRAELPLPENARYVFTIEAWTDLYATWLADLQKRVCAGMPVRSEVLEGAALLDRIRRKARREAAEALPAAVSRLRRKADDPAAAFQAASDPALVDLVAGLQSRDDAVVFPRELEIVADRPRALFGAWYEMFPRSQGTEPGRHATFREAERRLADIEAMGFDVLYLPPIHPVGKTHRKGRNNSLTAGPDDPGSPWAIGSGHGGHDAVEPALGTLDDFDRFVEAARRHGLEIALDFAIQCSPDHPWVKEHPEWFPRRPDGTVKFAENPPKKYEDIYPLDFDTPDREGLWNEHRRVFQHWIDHGVRVFRVDNPHTKPPVFWEWLLADIQSAHPDVLFLAEAFTKPPMMKALAKLGFTQSYTYFTWRNTKRELEDYLTELTRTEMRDYFRPNFFANTPDILPTVLVTGGPPAFRMRLVLAATLSPSYGIYSGYELCENAAMNHHAVPGEHEYADSEKYEIRVRDWDAPGNIKGLVSRLNRIRRENAALQELPNLRFLEADNDRILFYSKATADRSNVLLIAVNLDPHRAQECTVRVPPDEVGVPPGGTFEVHDLLTDAQYTWSERNYVRLDPAAGPAHILRVGKKMP